MESLTTRLACAWLVLQASRQEVFIWALVLTHPSILQVPLALASQAQQAQALALKEFLRAQRHS